MAAITYRDEIAGEIVKRIEEGTAPWQKPWAAGTLGAAPFNPVSGKPYRGINDMWLSLKGYADPRWMTYRQALEAGAQVRKAEKATTIEYWQWSERKPAMDEAGKPVLDGDGNPQYVEARLERPRVFLAKVFNAGQIDGLAPWIAPAPSFDPIERAEVLMAGAGVALFHDQADRAFYRPMTDEIHLPPRGSFHDAAGYYGTALHELGHATGHASRLDRAFGPFGSEGYAREELRAEIASYMLARDLGIGFDPGNHAAYVASWLKALQEDRNEIFHAARDAETIKTWVMEPGQRQSLEEVARTRAAAKAKGAVQQQDIAEPVNARTFLAVPYPEREAAKAAGARWDRDARSWYVPEGSDPAAFAAWIKAAEHSPTTAAGEAPSVGMAVPSNSPQQTQEQTTVSSAPETRTYLAVPFAEKDAAKAAGARWDRKAKSWYVPKGADPAPFAKWATEAGKAIEQPAIAPAEEFAEALKAHGLRLEGAPVMDGQWHRVAVEGDRKGQTSGSYRAFLDGRPCGQITNFKAGEAAVKWVATGVALTDEARARIQAEVAEAAAQREAQRVEAAKAAAKVAYGVWKNLPAAATRENCPYLKAKGVLGHGVKVDADGNLVVPARDAAGHLSTIQVIRDGRKTFLKESAKQGMMHVVEVSGKGTLASIRESKGNTIIVAEGYATAATLHESSGRPVVVAFDSGNLLPVAQAVRRTYPECDILIAADNDHANKLGNVGMKKATEAANAIGGRMFAPDLTPAEKAKGLTDFNDLAASRGRKVVLRAVEATERTLHRKQDLERSVA